MQRDPSDMDGNRARPASPGGAENAPSPSKRPRLDGGAPFNPNQGVMMPNGRPGQGMPGQQQVGHGPDSARALLLQHGINPTSLNPDQLQAFASAAPHLQAKTLASYSTNMSQHHGNQMPNNKPMPNAAGPQGQGSPMVPQGPDGNSLTQYYNPDMGPGNMRPGAPNGQATTGSNHALQDYQMQLMLLEQQNKKRLMMARQEQDLNTTTPRDGPGGPGGAPGPNGQAFQGTSPPGGRSGASPNPSDQMKRPNPQMANAANMGSPLPDGAAQSRSSPNSMNFMGGNMDPSAAQHFGMNMAMAGQMNGAMRPPSSHPPFNGSMNPQQMLAAQRQAQQAGAQGAPMQWPQGGPNGQMAGQPPQPQMQGGPAQNQRSMPPPSAPAAAAANAANARNPTASPQVTNAQPPTPQQGNKPAPKKKETKSQKAKVCLQGCHGYGVLGSFAVLTSLTRRRRHRRRATPISTTPERRPLPTHPRPAKRPRRRRRRSPRPTRPTLARTKVARACRTGSPRHPLPRLRPPLSQCPRRSTRIPTSPATFWTLAA